jgi:pSer/pThr/pTyr-binding forkhead associated (FHA) protein
MQDGYTRKIERAEPGRDYGDFFARHRVALVALSGAAAGSEYALEEPRVSLGRGPGVDLAFDDSAMSREHAAFELVEGAFRVRDLASTNGIRVNGSPMLAAELKHGDRLEIGEHEFQYILEEQEPAPRTYVIDDPA